MTTYEAEAERLAGRLEELDRSSEETDEEIERAEEEAAQVVERAERVQRRLATA
jgi:hypothetical protein